VMDVGSLAMADGTSGQYHLPADHIPESVL